MQVNIPVVIHLSADQVAGHVMGLGCFGAMDGGGGGGGGVRLGSLLPTELHCASCC